MASGNKNTNNSDQPGADQEDRGVVGLSDVQLKRLLAEPGTGSHQFGPPQPPRQQHDSADSANNNNNNNNNNTSSSKGNIANSGNAKVGAYSRAPGRQSVLLAPAARPLSSTSNEQQQQQQQKDEAATTISSNSKANIAAVPEPPPTNSTHEEDDDDEKKPRSGATAKRRVATTRSKLKDVDDSAEWSVTQHAEPAVSSSVHSSAKLFEGTTTTGVGNTTIPQAIPVTAEVVEEEEQAKQKMLEMQAKLAEMERWKQELEDLKGSSQLHTGNNSASSGLGRRKTTKDDVELDQSLMEALEPSCCALL